MPKALFVALCLAIGLTLFPASLTAQTAPVGPQTGAVLALLGEVNEKGLSCGKAIGASQNKEIARQQGKADARAAYAALIAARTACLAAQQGISTIKVPASITGELRTATDLLLSQSCSAVSGAAAYYLDLLAKTPNNSRLSFALSPAVPQDRKKEVEAAMAVAWKKLMLCRAASYRLAIQSGASDAEARTLVAGMLGEKVETMLPIEVREDPPYKADMLALLGDVRQKILFCTQAINAVDPDKNDARTIHAALIATRDNCLAEQQGMSALKIPVSITGDLRVKTDRMLTQSCPDALGAASQLTDQLVKMLDSGQISLADLGPHQKPNPKLQAIGTVAEEKTESCTGAMRELARQAGANDFEIASLMKRIE